MMNSHNRRPNTWRITIGNINSFPNRDSGPQQYKLDLLQKLVTGNNSDIVIISEHNKNLNIIPFKHQPSEIMKKWWPNTIVRSSFLASSSNSTFEPGGTMVVTNTRSTAHTCEAGADSQNLGRWNYISLRGKNHNYTTIISIYRPRKFQETYIRQTSYSAKRRKTIVEDPSPMDLWYSDLSILISQKIQDNHNVIIAGDFNDDLNNENCPTQKFMKNLGLKEILLETYGKGPNTHVRGSTTIDGVFATNGIHMEHGRYLSFESSPSDHRWIVLDITEASLIGSCRTDRTPPLLRKATSKIPSIKENFHILVEQAVLRYGLHDKLKTLKDAAESGKSFNEDHIKAYEAIESRMQKIIKHADTHCRKIRRGPVPFSPLQKQLMGAILILNQIKQRSLLKGKRNRPRSKRIQRLIRKYRFTGKSRYDNIEEIQKALDTAIQNYNKFKAGAKGQRWTYLDKIAREYNDRDGKGIQHHYKILHHREQVKEHFRQIKSREGRQRRGGVDKIQMDVNGQATIVYDKEIMEHEIMRVNGIKLLQAKNTPLRSELLSEMLGEQGDFDKWERILLGSVHLPDNTDESLRIWYNYITNIGSHTPSDITWTTEEYFASWAKIKEEKMTLPGIQVAHIKCIAPDSKAAEVLSTLALLPFMVGYSPKTWRNGIDSMIPKKIADLRPEKLRLILLMDARFNHGNKLIGKKMMEYGEKHNLLAPEQFGSRKAKSAIAHATNKRITLDILRQSGTNAIYIANDAKSCYDRIILMVAYLTMRNFGIPSLAAKSTISTIMNMKHFIRTKYGDSKDYYGGNKWGIKPHGCGQGNGYGPALWACISSPLLHILRQKGFGTSLYQPIDKQKIHFSAFAFVDDTDIIQTYNPTTIPTIPLTAEHIKDMFQITQSALDLWSGSLRATGGELEDSKTYFIPIIHNWKGSKAFLQRTCTDTQLHLKQHDRVQTDLEGKNPNDSFFTLGIWQSPSGNENKQIEHMVNQIKSWGQQTTDNKMPWVHARIAVKATIGRTLVYPLSATTFDPKQCKKLQRCFLQTTLGKIGIVRTASSILASAPISLGGLGLLSFELEQLTHHLDIMMQFGPDSSSTTGQLIRSTLEYHAIESGWPGDPLTIPPCTYTTKNTWIACILASLHKFHISMKSDIKGLQPWCDNDIFIMQYFANRAPPNVLTIINKVRLHLRVATVSDLLCADGLAYDRQLISGCRSNSSSQPSRCRYIWPNVAPPTRAERNVWTKEICEKFQIDLVTCRRQCNTPVRWRHTSVEYSRWLFSNRTGLLYERRSYKQQWHTWAPHHNRARYSTRSNSRTFKEHLTVDNTPDDTSPVSVAHNRGLVTITSTQAPVPCDHMGPTDRPVAFHTTPHMDPKTRRFMYNILLDNGIIFSDGSFHNHKASYAVLAQPCGTWNSITDIDYDQLFYHSGLVTGSEWDINSYRAELQGILIAITITNDLCQSTGITCGKCTLYCDNKGALSAAFGHKRPTPKWSSYDLVKQIRDAVIISPIRWSYHHVKSHQDDQRPFCSLDYFAQGNVIVDFLASRALTAATTDCVATRPWSPQVDGTPICGKLHSRIQYYVFRPLMIDKWCRTTGVPTHCRNHCDMDTFFQSLAAQPKNIFFNLIKFNAHLLPVGKNLLRRKHSQHGTCPGCGLFEDHEHLLLCTNPLMTETYDGLVGDIDKWLTDTTSPDIKQSVLTLLSVFRSPGQTQGESDNSRLCVLQLPLGRMAFFAGIWHKDWCCYQENFYKDSNLRRSASLWLVRLLHQIQSIPVHMWHQRNIILHQDDLNRNAQKHLDELNLMVDDIFARKPHPRTMAQCDNLFFRKHSAQQIKRMKLKRKTNWITGATLILAKYEQSTTEQMRRFASYFQWDDQG